VTQDNPYSPPKADLADRPRPPGSPVKAVLLGLLVDLGGSLLVGALLGVALAISVAQPGMTPEELERALTDISPGSWVSIVGTLAGAACSVLGGLVCARVARRPDYRLGFVLGVLATGSGLLLSFTQYSLAMNALLATLTFSCVLLGTWYGRVKT